MSPMSPVLASRFFTTEPPGKCPLDKLARARSDCGGLSEWPEPVRTAGACLKQAGLEGDCKCYSCRPGLVDVSSRLLKMADFQTSA